MSTPNTRTVTSAGTDGTTPLSELYELIAKQPFFAGLNPHHIQLLADSAVLIQFKPDRYIFQQGDQANRFYLILEGKVELEMESTTKAEIMVPIRTLSAGEDLGWDWLFPPFYFHATARVVEPTKTIAFFGTRLQQQCEEDHDLGYEIMKRIAGVTIQTFNALQRKLMECNDSKGPL